MMLSLRIHQQMLSYSYDLGIFEQVVRSYAEGHLPVSELRGPDYPVLGEHFSPILALLTPFYMLWPSPMLLLVAQALLIAISMVPLTFWARRALGDEAAAFIGVSYGLSWGIAAAVGFDFHEVAFAAPLLAFSLTALGENRSRAAVFWVLPLVLIKEDLGLMVAVIGIIIACRGERKLGFLTIAYGLGATALEMLVIMPALAPSDSYFHFSWLSSSGGNGPGDLLYRYTIGLITPQQKITTLLLLLSPTLFLALRSPLLWVALPTVLWRFASNLSSHWDTFGHYSLVLMPIVFAAFIDALRKRRARKGSVRRYAVGAAAICLLLLPHFPMWKIIQASTWRTDPRIAVAHSMMSQIPDGATVQTSNQLGPHLTGRTSVSLLGYFSSRPDPQWIMVDTWVTPDRRWPLNAFQEKSLLDNARARGYRTVDAREGFVLLSR
ncbi:DUF2079 domain-containing protein [Streptomyces sp. NPDC002187]|uniref:DUF2079 domain-containing protein n=1 Tax=Streptomyces sp. NPDC002187 TaxID=3364637 RepID=UPI0036835577